MTKSDLVQFVSEQRPEFSRKEMEMVVNTVFDEMTDALVDGERIEIRGFGSFSIRERAARGGRNPKTGESVQVPAKKVPFFRVGKELRERVGE